MPDDVNVLINFCEEQWAQARHTEEQRATVSNLILLVGSIIIGFVSQQSMTLSLLPLTIFLIVLGLFGALVTEKYYERFHYHHSKVGKWKQRLDELCPNAHLIELEKVAEAGHAKYWSNKLYKVRLHRLWLILNLFIAAIGTILTFLVFLS